MDRASEKAKRKNRLILALLLLVAMARGWASRSKACIGDSVTYGHNQKMLSDL